MTTSFVAGAILHATDLNSAFAGHADIDGTNVMTGANFVPNTTFLNQGSDDTQVANRKFVRDAIAGDAGGGAFLPLVGGTLTGNVAISTGAVNPFLTLRANAGTARVLQWQTGLGTRWRLQTNSTAEVVGDPAGVGSDFEIASFGDAGVIGVATRYTRGTGDITWNPNTTFLTPTYWFRGNDSSVRLDGTLSMLGTRTLETGKAMGTETGNPMLMNLFTTYTGVLDTGAPTLGQVVVFDTIKSLAAPNNQLMFSFENVLQAGFTGSRGGLNTRISKQVADATGADVAIQPLGVYATWDAGESSDPLNPLGRCSCVNFDGRIGGPGGQATPVGNNIAVRVLLICESDLRLFSTNFAVSKGNWGLHNGIGDAEHGDLECYGLSFSSSPLIPDGTGGNRTFIQLGGSSNGWPGDSTQNSGAIIQWIPTSGMRDDGTLGPGLGLGATAGPQIPKIPRGIDLHGIFFKNHAWRSTGFWVDGDGQIPVLGPGAITYSTVGVKIAVPNIRTTTLAVVSGGSNYRVGDQLVTPLGGLWNVTATSVAGAITGIAQAKVGYGAVAPANPVTLVGGCGSGATANLVSAATGSLNLLDAGQKLGFFGATAVVKPTVSGAKGSNAALGSLISALATYGLITDTTTA